MVQPIDSVWRRQVVESGLKIHICYILVSLRLVECHQKQDSSMRRMCPSPYEHSRTAKCYLSWWPMITVGILWVGKKLSLASIYVKAAVGTWDPSIKYSEFRFDLCQVPHAHVDSFSHVLHLFSFSVQGILFCLLMVVTTAMCMWLLWHHADQPVAKRVVY